MPYAGHSERKGSQISLQGTYGVQDPPMSSCFHSYLLETKHKPGIKQSSDEQIHMTASQIISALIVLYARVYLFAWALTAEGMGTHTGWTHDPGLFQEKEDPDVVL